MTTPAAAGSRVRITAETTASVLLLVVLSVYLHVVLMGFFTALRPVPEPLAPARAQVMINAPGGVQAGRNLTVTTGNVVPLCSPQVCSNSVPMYPWKGRWITGPELVQLVDEDAHKENP